MATEHDDRLAREARVFSTYLVGLPASDYVVAKYAAYHDAHTAMDARAGSAFDRFLLGLARIGGIATRVADVYAARFAKTSLLARKLILTVALLECAPTTFEVFDRPTGGSRPLVWLGLAGRGLVEVLWLVPGLVVVGIPHLALAFTRTARAEGTP